MVDAVSRIGAESIRIAQLDSSGASPGGPGDVNDADVQRFLDTLNRGEGNPAGETKIIGDMPILPDQVQNVSPGQHILNKLEGLRNAYSDQLSQVEAGLSAGNGADGGLSVSDIFRTQVALHQMTISIDLSAKIVNKVTQSIDTMIKSN